MKQVEKILALGLASLLLSGPVTAQTSEVLGQQPKAQHIANGPSPVAISHAITKMIWAPGLDNGDVPQGMAWADGFIYVSSYNSDKAEVDRGPCRIFKINPNTGETLATFNFPTDAVNNPAEDKKSNKGKVTKPIKSCGHVGGLVYVGKNTLIASDTRRLYKIDTNLAFGGGDTTKAIVATVALQGLVKGSFIDFDGSHLFVGTWATDTDTASAKGYFFPLSIFKKYKDDAIDEKNASRAIPLPVLAQGAVFDLEKVRKEKQAEGDLWVTSSNSKSGKLHKINSLTGQIISTHDMVIGIEDLTFDNTGGLWAVSEAGTLRFKHWKQAFPVLFRVDLNKLLGLGTQ